MARDAVTLPRIDDPDELLDPTKVGPPSRELLRAAALPALEKDQSGVTLASARASDSDLVSESTDPLVSAFYTRSVMEDALQDAETLQVASAVRAAVVDAVDARAARRTQPRVFFPIEEKSDLRLAVELVLGSLAVIACVAPVLYWLFA